MEVNVWQLIAGVATALAILQFFANILINKSRIDDMRKAHEELVVKVSNMDRDGLFFCGGRLSEEEAAALIERVNVLSNKLHEAIGAINTFTDVLKKNGSKGN